MSDEHLDDHDEADEPMSPRAKIIASSVAVVVLIAAAAVLMRLSSPAIASDRQAPAGHYALPCPLCHSISAATDAKVGP
jgi:cytochrome c2